MPKVLEAREGGSDLVDIAQIFQRSGTLSVVWKDTGIDDPCKFAGKKVGVWDFGNEYEVTAGALACGLTPGLESGGDPAKQYQKVIQPFDMTLLLSRQIDVAEAMIYNEYAQVLEATNPATGALYTPEDLNVINWNDYRVAMLQDAIFARKAWLDEGNNRDVAVRFVRASLKGWIYCRDNPDDCVQYTTDAGSQLGAGHQAWMMNEINALVWPSPLGVGVLDPVFYGQTVRVSKNAGIIKADPSPDAYDASIAKEALESLTDMDTKGDASRRAPSRSRPAATEPRLPRSEHGPAQRAGPFQFRAGAARADRQGVRPWPSAVTAPTQCAGRVRRMLSSELGSGVRTGVTCERSSVSASPGPARAASVARSRRSGARSEADRASAPRSSACATRIAYMVEDAARPGLSAGGRLQLGPAAAARARDRRLPATSATSRATIDRSASIWRAHTDVFLGALSGMGFAEPNPNPASSGSTRPRRLRPSGPSVRLSTARSPSSWSGRQKFGLRRSVDWGRTSSHRWRMPPAGCPSDGRVHGRTSGIPLATACTAAERCPRRRLGRRRSHDACPTPTIRTRAAVRRWRSSLLVGMSTTTRGTPVCVRHVLRQRLRAPDRQPDVRGRLDRDDAEHPQRPGSQLQPDGDPALRAGTRRAQRTRREARTRVAGRGR